MEKKIPIEQLPLNEKYWGKDWSGDKCVCLSKEESQRVIHGIQLEDGFIRPVLKDLKDTSLSSAVGEVNSSYAYNKTQMLWEKLTTSTGGGLDFMSSPVHEYPGFCM